MSGYVSCGCRDCFEIAIGEPGAFCHACVTAGCEEDSECQAPGAYGGRCDCGDPRGDGHPDCPANDDGGSQDGRLTL